MFGDEVIKILLDPDHLGIIEVKSNKIWHFRIPPPFSNMAPTIYRGKHPKPKQTFKDLVRICIYDVVMKIHDVFYRPLDGLAM